MDAFAMASMMLMLVWPVLLAGLLLHVVPDLMRPGLFFGVTVEDRFRESQHARQIRRRYSTAIWAATLTVIALGVIAVFAAPRVDWVRTAVGALAARTGLRQAFGSP